MVKVNKSVVLATGGTGGHVFPALALAEELSSQGYKVIMFTDGRGHQFHDASFEHRTIPSSQLQGPVTRKLKSSLKLLKGLSSALYHLKLLQPNAVVGFGGYASFPTMSAATILRLPRIVHQADAYLGRTNHLLAPYMTRIATSFPHVSNIPPSCQSKVSFTGLPVRPDIKYAPYVPSKGLFHLLVTGGSQGARVFGEILPQAIHLMDPAHQKRLRIQQQCRPEYLEMTKALYERTSAQVELAPFLDKMGARYKKAHLIISRAGGSSVIEAASVGRPALFVPYPYAMDDHQTYNANEAVKVKGGWLMGEKEFTINAVAAFLSEMITSPWKLEEAAGNIRSIAIEDAPLRLAHLIKLIGN